MFQRELLIIAAIVAAIFLVVAGTGWLAIRELHETSRMLVVDTLPGLVDAGLAGERMNDNRRTMRELLAPHTAAERTQMISQIRTNSTEALWRDYARSVFEPEDQRHYQALMRVRADYLQGCEHFFDLVTADNLPEAAAWLNGELTRRFLSYNEIAKQLFDYNTQQGVARGKTILQAIHHAPWVMAAFCALLFGLGLALGLRSHLSGGK